ncbi:MAG: hypothetical protein K5907_00570 [Treponema sp.]|nr:hypothetical protein [Treponema sp.]
MGIQPIDLQNMYSQMSNVAKTVAGQQQAATVAEQVQKQDQTQKNIEQLQRVQQTNNDKANTNNVNADGHHGGSGTYQNPNKKRKDGSQKETTFSAFNSTKPEYVGTIVDITR